jgi:2-phosphosulfolactate phosphatase
MKTLDILYTPADFAALGGRKLDDTLCVVFDVFRASSSMVTALARGARAIVPVAEIPEALEWRRRDPATLLAGERHGVRIRADLTGGVEFDLGNSPREFTRERVADRTIVMSTTNGTRALRACAHAKSVWIAGFLNLQATANRIGRERPARVVLIGSGTFEQAAYEDVLAAGALCDALLAAEPADEISDGALMARELYRSVRDDLAAAAASSRNGRRLLGRPELADDVPFCLQRDIYDFAAALQPDGTVRRVP